MFESSLTLEGVGLRSGRPASVVLRPRPGPFAFRVAEIETLLSVVRVEETDRATLVRAGATSIATVEHVLAALAAFGLHDGLALEVRGGEVPLLDGASGAFVRALERLAVPATPAPLSIVKDATLSSGHSQYTFRRASTTGRDASRVEVTLSFDDPRIAADAFWTGDRADFVRRIAAARTFAFAHEVSALVDAGYASHVDPGSVVVLAPDAVFASGAPFTADEPARHKVLDLMGDLFLYGGPPRGTVHALRPGHRATHTIMREALARGVVAR